MYVSQETMKELVKGRPPATPSELGFCLAFDIIRYMASMADQPATFNKLATISGVLDAVHTEFKTEVLHPLMGMKKNELGKVFPTVKAKAPSSPKSEPMTLRPMTPEDIQNAWDLADKLMAGIINKPKDQSKDGPAKPDDGTKS